jgi:hypothetical protein
MLIYTNLKFRELLKLKSSPNGGVGVTDDLKYTGESSLIGQAPTDDVMTVKFSRQNGIHVSPTVLWDGLVAGDISSGWGDAEWTKFLKTNVT